MRMLIQSKDFGGMEQRLEDWDSLNWVAWGYLTPPPGSFRVGVSHPTRFLTRSVPERVGSIPIHSPCSSGVLHWEVTITELSRFGAIFKLIGKYDGCIWKI